MIVKLIDGSTREIPGCFCPGPRGSAVIIGPAGVTHRIHNGRIHDLKNSTTARISEVLL